MNVSPYFFGQGIAGSLLKRIIGIAEDQSLPVRLVSSAQNLDSFSLYSRQGFAPTQAFQDMYLEVPKEGLDIELFSKLRVANAHMEDVEDMADWRKIFVESKGKKISSILSKTKRYLENRTLQERSRSITWISFICGSSSLRMIGPGVASEKVAVSMLADQLENFRGKTPVFLLPVTAKLAVQSAYSWGA